MLTYTSRRNLFGTLSGNNSAANLTVGDSLMNQYDREIATSKPWNFREKTKTDSSVAEQQFNNLPFDCGILQNVTVTSGTTVYSPKFISSRDKWDKINQVSGYTSNAPEYAFVYGDQVGFYPILSTSDLTITYSYLKKARDLSVADYTTGNISAVTNGETTVTGSGTTWTSGMVGRYLQIDNGFWYEIESVESATSLTLARGYDGATISGGSASYIIGQVSIIPEDFQILPVYRALEVFYTSIQPEKDRAQMYKTLYQEGLNRMQGELGTKNINPTV